MALLFECMLQCAQKVLDAADIVRDGDFATIDGVNRLIPGRKLGMISPDLSTRRLGFR